MEKVTDIDMSQSVDGTVQPDEVTLQQSDGFQAEPLQITYREPIESLTWLEKSLGFAELSRLAYGGPELVSEVARAAGIDGCELIAKDGAEVYIFATPHDCMIVSRGTEPNKWDDISADANAWPVAFDIGRVHSGFHQHVQLLWPEIEQRIQDIQRPVWFAGHSLGGAMATVCAVRCRLSPISSNPRAIFTYGAPRVGNRSYVNAVRIPHYRWVNNNDIVPRFPPRWMGYWHIGYEIYLNRRGNISRLHSWLRVHDRMRGLWTSLLRGRVDFLSDHSMSEYIVHLRDIIESEKQGKRISAPRGLR